MRNTSSAGGTGIEVASSSGTQIVRNNVNGAHNDGIIVSSTATASVLLKNVAHSNGADGIDVLSTDAATTITKNRADHNTDFGIDAALGVTDGGGNRARGNGNTAQCSPNISCA
jgi:parallel beta-helix repeat protein